MNEPVHEWVENFDEYEAVFLCKNSLGSWDTDVAIRAFQTFGWDDATMPGTDLTFKHALSAVMIRYDGNVLAINFGNGHLSDAFPDLFLAITGLGWQNAEVYHRPETMSALLNDIGAAIPASMTFDVIPAKAVIAVSSFAEANSLVNRGRAALQTGSESNGVGAMMFEELESMMPTALDSASMPAQQPAGGVATPKTVSILLEDIDDHADDHNGIVAFVQPNVQQKVNAARPVARAGSLPFEDELRDLSPAPSERVASQPHQPSPPMQAVAPSARVIPVGDVAQPVQAPITVVALHDLVAAHANAQAVLVIENEHLRDALSIADERLAEEKEVVRRLVEDQERPVVQEHAPWLEPEVPVVVAQSVVDENIFQEVSVEAPFGVEGAVHLGASSFCFDLPDAPMPNDDVNRMAEGWKAAHLNQVLSVIHIHPGAIGESLRWDVFGDLPTEYPWAAQKMASAMGFSDDHCPLMASILMALKQTVTFAQLRDVLEAMPPEGGRTGGFWQGSDGAISSEMKPLFARLCPADGGRLGNEIVSRLGGLALCPEGRAFVDVRCAGDDLAPEMQEMFSLREVVQSPLARLFVVHVDALDGPFVTWIVGLLKAMALSYSMTGRYSVAVEEKTQVQADPLVMEVVPLASLEEDTDAEPVKDAREKMASVATQIAEVTVVVNDLLAQLRQFTNMV